MSFKEAFLYLRMETERPEYDPLWEFIGGFPSDDLSFGSRVLRKALARLN